MNLFVVLFAIVGVCFSCVIRKNIIFSDILVGISWTIPFCFSDSFFAIYFAFILSFGGCHFRDPLNIYAHKKLNKQRWKKYTKHFYLGTDSAKT